MPQRACGQVRYDWGLSWEVEKELGSQVEMLWIGGEGGREGKRQSTKLPCGTGYFLPPKFGDVSLLCKPTRRDYGYKWAENMCAIYTYIHTYMERHAYHITHVYTHTHTHTHTHV